MAASSTLRNAAFLGTERHCLQPYCGGAHPAAQEHFTRFGLATSRIKMGMNRVRGLVTHGLQASRQGLVYVCFGDILLVF